MATEGLVGKTFGKYRITEQLGRGGMAEVYKAYQPGLDRYVAVKVMHAFLAEDKDFLARFQREAKLVASMRHPNIVQVHDFDVEGGHSYMVMEFIDGETLKARLQNLEEKEQWIPIDEGVRIILAVGSALKYAHRLGMVHRDVKPANVMVDKHGGVILTDFGIAKIFAGGAQTQLTATGAMVGTPSYMSPEQGMGQAGDERSDIYSLGVMLYQMVTGRLPFEADTPLAVVIKHINDPLPMPRVANPEVSEPVERVVLKAMAKNPDDRYQHVGDMLNDLKRAMGMALDETPTDTMRARALPAGATAVATGAVTPFPTTARKPATVVAPVSGPTVISPQAKAKPEVAKPGPSKALIGVGVAAAALVVIAVIVGVLVLSSSGQGKKAGATLTAQAIAAQPTSTVAPTQTPVPSTATPASVIGTVNANNVKLRQSPSESAADFGLLPQGAKLTVRQRTADNTWLRVETADNNVGWVAVKEVDLGQAKLAEIPQSTLLTVPTATPNLAATATACKPAAQVADVTVPDGTQFKPGEAFVKTWRLTSSGNCVWEKGSTLVFQSGEKMDAPASVAVDSVEVGKSIEVSANLKAPTAPGSYTGQWIFQRPSGQAIAALDVSIVVVAPTPTTGPQPTLPPVSTPRPAATPTPGAGAGGIPPVGSGNFSAPPDASGPWNCARVSENEWAGDFFVEVYGGPGNYTISDIAHCRWDSSQQKFVCRFTSRYDGSVSQVIQVSCPGCKPQSVTIFGRAVTSGKDMPANTCKAP